MTKISRRFLNKELEKHIFELFLKTITDINTLTEAQSFIEDLLSPTERIMITKRLAIAVLLTKGYTYDDIDDTLKVSRATIMNVSLWLRSGKNGYRNAVNKILEKQQRESLIDKVNVMEARLLKANKGLEKNFLEED